jgi:glucose-6-phosphate 1-epimerase
MSIQSLNETYGIEGQLQFVAGPNGMPHIEINTPKAQALISVYAGQVLAYKPVGQSEDLLFLSEKAYYQAGKAIKGGIPICWPWFGADPLGQGRPAHGFARNNDWNVIETGLLDDGTVTLGLRLNQTEATQALWSEQAELSIEIQVGDCLRIALLTHNKGQTAISITQALHTYFRIGEIARTRVSGLDGCRYIDKANDGRIVEQQADVTIEAEVDRIYETVPSSLVIHDDALGRKIKIHSEGNDTAVVWNPWIAIAQEMADLNDDDYQRFICVETTNAADDVVEVAAGEVYRLSAEYCVSS